MAADRIRAGGASILIAGGSESISLTPRGGARPTPNPWFVDHCPEIYLTMGLTAERVQRKYGVSREDADLFSFRSHQNAIRAQALGNFDEEIVPVEVTTVTPERTATTVFRKDEGPRADTNVEALAKLKPVFHAHGTVTAGNSSQTSDGAAAALVMSASAARRAFLPRLWGLDRSWQFRKLSRWPG
jgi:acetyl-CoA acyltransferase